MIVWQRTAAPRLITRRSSRRSWGEQQAVSATATGGTQGLAILDNDFDGSDEEDEDFNSDTKEDNSDSDNDSEDDEDDEDDDEEL